MAGIGPALRYTQHDPTTSKGAHLMAAQTYVEIAKSAVKDIFDSKFKANAVKAME
jgi:hypothetical protein